MNLFCDFLGLIFPKVCFGCEEVLLPSEKHLCLSCLSDLPMMYQLNSFNPVKTIFDGKVIIENARSFLEFENGNKTQRIIHELKYRNNPSLARFMGQLMGKGLFDFYKEAGIDAVIPVPLHYGKKLKRGYNQAEMLAAGISDVIGITVFPNVLKRTKRTKSQTKKSRYERWKNVSSVFAVNPKPAIYPKHILLVDDVITTGATAEACIACLTAEFACKVTVVSLARAA